MPWRSCRTVCAPRPCECPAAPSVWSWDSRLNGSGSPWPSRKHAACCTPREMRRMALAMSVSLGPLICRRRPSLSMIAVPANSTPRIRAWAGLSIGSKNSSVTLPFELIGEQLIELHRFPHHRVVEERHMHRLFQPLEHLLRLARTASTARSSSCRRARERRTER